MRYKPRKLLKTYNPSVQHCIFPPFLVDSSNMKMCPQSSLLPLAFFQAQYRVVCRSYTSKHGSEQNMNEIINGCEEINELS